jgi:hypothetical protein
MCRAGPDRIGAILDEQFDDGEVAAVCGEMKRLGVVPFVTNVLASHCDRSVSRAR